MRHEFSKVQNTAFPFYRLRKALHGLHHLERKHNGQSFVHKNAEHAIVVRSHSHKRQKNSRASKSWIVSLQSWNSKQVTLRNRFYPLNCGQTTQTAKLCNVRPFTIHIIDFKLQLLQLAWLEWQRVLTRKMLGTRYGPVGTQFLWF